MSTFGPKGLAGVLRRAIAHIGFGTGNPNGSNVVVVNTPWVVDALAHVIIALADASKGIVLQAKSTRTSANPSMLEARDAGGVVRWSLNYQGAAMGQVDNFAPNLRLANTATKTLSNVEPPRIQCKTLTTAMTITLPNPTTGVWEYEIKDTDYNAAVNNITIVVPAGVKLNGVLNGTVVLNKNGASVRIWADRTDAHILSAYLWP